MPVVIEQVTTAIVDLGNTTNDLLVEGDRFERDVSFTDDSDGSAINFTGWTATGVIKDADDTATTIGTFTITGGGTSGIWNIVLDPIPAACVGRNPYDIQITDGGSVKTLMRGKFEAVGQFTT